MTGTRNGSAKTDLTPALRIAHRLANYLRNDWLRILLLIFIGFAARTPALSGQFVWDDEFLARDNPLIKSPLLIFEAFRHHLFLDSYAGHYRPMQNISFMADYFFWNSNVYGFHLTNVILHLSSGVLLYFLLRPALESLCPQRTSGEAKPENSSAISLTAFLAALIWSVHPVHSAAIDYISGRADSLAFVFACGGWLLYLRAREIRWVTARVAAYGLAAIAGLLALCSRETALIWFAIFLLHTIFFQQKGTSRRASVATLAVCLCLLGVYLCLRHLPEQRPGPGPTNGWSKTTRGVLMLRALGDYGRLMVFPSNLHMERDVFDPENYRSPSSWKQSAGTEYLSIVGLFLFGGLLFATARKSPGQRMRIFGAAWFVCGFLPCSNIIELNATVAEHWLYLPSVGALIFLAGCALDLPARYRQGAIAFACVAVAGLSVRSAVRSSDWATAETFYQRTVEAGGKSVRVAVNLGQIYSDRGEYAKAEAAFWMALQMAPGYPVALNNLATAFHRQGKHKQAEAIFETLRKAAIETRKEYPRTWLAALNLARLRHRAMDDKGALAILERAHTEYPHTWEIISFEAELIRQNQGPEAALRRVEDFARENWWHYRAFLALGRLYSEKGETEQANAAFHHASWLDVHDVESLNLIALMRVRQNRFDEACRAQRRAVARQPDEPRQYILLSNILEKMGRFDEAHATIAQVARLQHLAQAPLATN
jgi:Flp pilus assembly protein TadD